MKPLSRWLRQWSGVGDLSDKAAAVAAEAFADPSDAATGWLAQLTKDRDEDHARWELRYARRSLFFHAARLDSLTDRIPSAVGHAIEEALASDPDVDVSKRAMAAQQFNTRLRAYGQALDERDGRPQMQRMGELLLSLSGVSAPGSEKVAGAVELLNGMLREANASLRTHFGTAHLPEDVEPSRVAGGSRR